MKKLVVAPLHYFFSDFRDPLPDNFELRSGYVIKRFDSSVLDPVFEFFGRYHSQEDQEELRRCMYAVYYEYEVGDKGTTIPEEIVANINRFTQALRIVKRTRTVATIIHLNITNNQITATDALQIIPKPSQDVTYMDHDEDLEYFVNADTEPIIRYFEMVKALYRAHGGTYHRVLNAIIFFEIAHFERLYKPRLILFVTCLESLFNTSSEQVGYMIRTRCSYFLERDPEGRIQLSKLIKTIYDLRSMFVHGQSTPSQILENLNTQKELLMQTEDICRRCIGKIFDSNLMGAFDNNRILTDEFTKLELGANSLLN